MVLTTATRIFVIFNMFDWKVLARICILLIFNLSNGMQLLGQAAKTAVAPSQQLNFIEARLNAGQLEEAMAAFNELKSDDYSDSTAYYYHRLGSTLTFRLGRFDASVSHLRTLLHLSYKLDYSAPSKGLTLFNLGKLLSKQGQVDSAKLLLFESINEYRKANLPIDVADCWRTLGNIYIGQHDYFKAIEAMTSAQEILHVMKRHGEVDSINQEYYVQQLAWCYFNLAEFYHRVDDRTKVRIYLKYSQDLLEKYSDQFPYIKKEALENQGRIFNLLGDYQESITSYLALLNSPELKHSAQYELHILLKIAQVFGGPYQQFEHAIAYWRRALDFAKEGEMDQSSELVPMYRELARCYINNNQPVLARQSLEAAWSLVDRPGMNLQRAILYFNEARLAILTTDYEKAIHYIDTAQLIFDFPKSASLANILVLKSFAYLKLYKQTERIDDLNTSIHLSKKALDVLIAYEEQHFSRTSEGNAYRRCIEMQLEGLFLLSDIRPDDTTKDEIFQLLELGKARTIRQNLSFEQLYATNSSDIINQYESLKSRRAILLNEYYNKENQKSNSHQIEIGYELSMIESSLQEALNKIKVEQKVKGSQWNIINIQQNLPRESAVILYFMGDSTIYSFSIHKTGVLGKRLILKKDALSLLEDISAHVTNLRISEDTLGTELFEAYEIVLLPQIRELPKSIKHLQLVADGPLLSLPWAALCTSAPKTHDFRRWPYLINTYSVSNLPTTRLLAETSSDRSRAEIACIAVDSIAGEVLNGIDEELSSLRHLYDADYTSFRNSDNFRFIKDLNDFPILHFATHAFPNIRQPIQSYFLFPDSNRLTMLHLLSSNVKAELISLGACNTGKGPWQPGIGIVSMAHIFLQSGSNSVLSNTWAYSDRLTEKVITAFHKNLRNQIPLNESLQLAQLDYVENAKPELSAHPFYWAGLQIHGNTKPFKVKKRAPIVPFIVGLIGLLYLLRRLMISRAS